MEDQPAAHCHWQVSPARVINEQMEDRPPAMHCHWQVSPARIVNEQMEDAIIPHQQTRTAIGRSHVSPATIVNEQIGVQ